MLPKDFMVSSIKCFFFIPDRKKKKKIKFIWELHKKSLKMKWFCNHNMSLKNKSTRNDTTLVKYVWNLHILKYAPYSNITQKCKSCFQEKFEILSYPNNDEQLNKRSKAVMKCRHVNKFLLAIYSE